MESSFVMQLQHENQVMLARLTRERARHLWCQRRAERRARKIQHLEHNLATQHQNSDKLISRCKHLSSQLSLHKAQSSCLESELDEMAEQTYMYKSQLEDAHAAETILRTKYMNLRACLEGLEEENTGLKKTIDRLEDENDVMTDSLSIFKQMLGKCYSDLAYYAHPGDDPTLESSDDDDASTIEFSNEDEDDDDASSEMGDINSDAEFSDDEEESSEMGDTNSDVESSDDGSSLESSEDEDVTPVESSEDEGTDSKIVYVTHSSDDEDQFYISKIDS
jgi:chromosome segregation ATPase